MLPKYEFTEGQKFEWYQSSIVIGGCTVSCYTHFPKGWRVYLRQIPKLWVDDDCPHEGLARLRLMYADFLEYSKEHFPHWKRFMVEWIGTPSGKLKAIDNYPGYPWRKYIDEQETKELKWRYWEWPEFKEFVKEGELKRKKARKERLEKP